MLSSLQEKFDIIRALYQSHLDTVLDLQFTLRDDICPRSVDGLADRNSQWVRDWADDLGSIFRMFKKHQFNIAETNQALERTLAWRISELELLSQDRDGTHNSFIKCLPSTVHDMFGRPVLLIQLAKLRDASESTKQDIVHAHEKMRQRLCLQKNDNDPILQFVMIIDFKGVAMRSMVVELVPWFIREVAPRFPGMCAAVFVVNYSWAYGMYSVLKRLLPANVLARIYFPSASELLSCFDSEHFPLEYGGTLDLTSNAQHLSANFSNLGDISNSSAREDCSPNRSPSNINISRFLPSMSLLNPHFGYPAISGPGSSVPYLKNGRRRKRDLARTLCLLWFAKLQQLSNKTWVWIAMTLALWAIGLRRDLRS